MNELSKKLKEYSVVVDCYETPDEHYGLEFDVRDAKDDERYASVWTDENGEVQYDCEHPSHLIEYDEDEGGKCLLCGSHCDYIETEDEEFEDGDEFTGPYTYKVTNREPVSWDNVAEPEGLLMEIYNDGKEE